MKKLLLGMFIVGSFSSYAESTPEIFARANDGEVMVQVAAASVKSEAEIKFNGQTLKSEWHSTQYSANVEYGINKDIAVGMTVLQMYADGESGMADNTFTLRGQKEKFHYNVAAEISSGTQADDNFYNGGNSYSFMVGYQVLSYLTLSINHTLAYDYETESDVDGDTNTNGGSTSLSAYYERMLSPGLLGVGAYYSTAYADESNGEKVGEDSKYLSLLGYMNFKTQYVEVVPRVSYGKYMGDDDDISSTVTLFSVMLRKRF